MISLDDEKEDGQAEEKEAQPQIQMTLSKAAMVSDDLCAFASNWAVYINFRKKVKLLVLGLLEV